MNMINYLLWEHGWLISFGEFEHSNHACSLPYILYSFWDWEGIFSINRWIQSAESKGDEKFMRRKWPEGMKNRNLKKYN